jgi:hypothetical protein
MPKTNSKVKKDKVAIVGFAPTCHDTPFDRKDMEFWGMNELWPMFPQANWDRWFDLHHKHVVTDSPRSGTKHYEWLKNRTIPVYMLEKDEDVPSSVPFPLEEAGNISWDGTPYFTSTPAYMVALAIMEGFKEIHLYGINLLGKEEYAYQKPCTEYWLGVAWGKGIKIVIAEGATILKSSFLYGYETHGKETDDFLTHLKYKFQEHVQKKKEIENAMQQVSAAIETMKYFITIYQGHLNGIPIPDLNKMPKFQPTLDQAIEPMLVDSHEKTPVITPPETPN